MGGGRRDLVPPSVAPETIVRGRELRGQGRGGGGDRGNVGEGDGDSIIATGTGKRECEVMLGKGKGKGREMLFPPFPFSPLSLVQPFELVLVQKL